MTQLLRHMADTNANIAEFKSKFNGENRDVIRFVFDIQRYEAITDFQSPNALFNNIYNVLPPWIQQKFVEDKTNTVIQQQQALPAQDATAEQIDAASRYTMDSMQQFFIKNCY